MTTARRSAGCASVWPASTMEDTREDTSARARGPPSPASSRASFRSACSRQYAGCQQRSLTFYYWPPCSGFGHFSLPEAMKASCEGVGHQARALAWEADLHKQRQAAPPAVVRLGLQKQVAHLRSNTQHSPIDLARTDFQINNQGQCRQLVNNRVSFSSTPCYTSAPRAHIVFTSGSDLAKCERKQCISFQSQHLCLDISRCQSGPKRAATKAARPSARHRPRRRLRLDRCQSRILLQSKHVHTNSSDLYVDKLGGFSNIITMELTHRNCHTRGGASSAAGRTLSMPEALVERVLPPEPSPPSRLPRITPLDTAAWSTCAKFNLTCKFLMHSSVSMRTISHVGSYMPAS